MLLSLRISLAAVVLGCLIGLPLGAAIAVNEFRGRRAVIVILNGLMGLPSVVVGLVVYLLLSRAGPLGSWGILFTPTAMVIAQTILITPTIAALSRQIVADAWQEYREQLRSLGETRLGAAPTLLWDLRFSLMTIVLAGFGRAASEVGAVMIVGGNIDGVTRVMTTTIALETSKGDLPLALGARLHPAVDRARPQCRRLRRQGDGAAAVRLTGAMDMRAPLSLLPLRLDGVEFEVGARRIIQGVSATFDAGPRTVILGPNGAGKSVLLRLCHGLLAPTAGSDRVECAGDARRAAAPGDGVPAAGAAAAHGARQRDVCAEAGRRRARACARSAPGKRCAGRPRRAGGPCGAGIVRRRAAAARAGAGLGAAPGGPVPRRADGEPRPGRDARDREHHPRPARGRHQDRAW